MPAWDPHVNPDGSAKILTIANTSGGPTIKINAFDWPKYRSMWTIVNTEVIAPHHSDKKA